MWINNLLDCKSTAFILQFKNKLQLKADGHLVGLQQGSITVKSLKLTDMTKTE